MNQKEKQKKHAKSHAAESNFLAGSDVVIIPFDAAQVQACKVTEVHKYDMTIDHDTEQKKLHKLDCAMAIKQEHASGIQQHLQMHTPTRGKALPRPTRKDVVAKGAKIQSFAPNATGRITLRCGISFFCQVLENRSFVYLVAVEGIPVLVWKHAIHNIEQDRKRRDDAKT